MAQGGEVPYAEMFGTFALSVGAAVSFLDWKLTTSFLQLHINSYLSIELFRWEWSSGRDGHIKLCGTLHYGICTRFVMNQQELRYLSININ